MLHAAPAAALAAWLTAAWFAALAALVGYRALSGGIALGGLLSTDGAGAVDPERVQLVIVTLLGAAYYARSAVASAGDPALAVLPEIPADVLAVIVGSQFLYLGGKLGRRLGAGGTP